MEYYATTFAAGSDYAYYTPEEEANNRTTDKVPVADAPQRSHVADLLVNWHIQEYVLPLEAEEVILFDPMDESQVDLTGLPNTEGL